MREKLSNPTPPYQLPPGLVYEEWTDGGWSITRDLGHGVTRGTGGPTTPTAERWAEVVAILTEGE